MRKPKQKLSKREEQLLQVLWTLEEGSATDIAKAWPDISPSQEQLAQDIESLKEKGLLGARPGTDRYFPIQELTKAEEQIMQVLWKLKKAFVKDVIKELPGKPLAYNTVSTIIRILEKKGFVGHTPFGKTYEYYPLIEKSKYSNFFLKNFMSKYFGGSFEKMVSFFVQQNDVDASEFEDLMKYVEKDLKNSENPST